MAGMFKVIGPTSLRSIAAHLVNVRDQSKLFSFISASDGILQLVTSGEFKHLCACLLQRKFFLYSIYNKFFV